MLYRAKVGFLRSPYGHRAYRRWSEWRTGQPRPKTDLDFLRGRVEGRSFVDVGCMWNIYGRQCFEAEELGATKVTGVDIFVDPRFHEEREKRQSKVEFIQADATRAGPWVDQVGPTDVVWCFGVMYHIPDPLSLLRNLRTLCKEQLLLEGFTAPEVPGVSGAAVWIPYLDTASRRMWAVEGAASTQLGVTEDYSSDEGFGNNFWAMSPSAMTSMLRAANFAVDRVEPSLHGPLRHVFYCRPI